MTESARKTLLRLFAAGVAAVDPARCLPAHLPLQPPAGRTLVGGAGKAAASMALALHRGFLDRGIASPAGLVVTRYGHGLRPGETTGAIEVIEAGHPVPDEAGVRAGTRMLDLMRSARAADRCIFLLSGGASALLVRPAAGLSLADKQRVTRALLAAGAPISDMNTVRRALSAIKGGGLARACRAGEILVLAISDVPGDRLEDIGSGPFTPDPGGATAAADILHRHGIEPELAAWLARREAPADAPPAGAPPVPVRAEIIARSRDALASVAAAAAAAGYVPHVLPDVHGPARDAAAAHADVIRAIGDRGHRSALISGGETTVQVSSGAGRGGRNGEYLLALALALGPRHGVHALAADTDGIDGTGDNAGALIAPDTLGRAAAAGRDAATDLAAQCSREFFAALGDLVVTGPTRTNVNDLRITLLD